MRISNLRFTYHCDFPGCDSSHSCNTLVNLRSFGWSYNDRTTRCFCPVHAPMFRHPGRPKLNRPSGNLLSFF